MADATVADELAFAAWTDEQKRIARVVLQAELRKTTLGLIHDALHDLNEKVEDLMLDA